MGLYLAHYGHARTTGKNQAQSKDLANRLQPLTSGIQNILAKALDGIADGAGISSRRSFKDMREPQEHGTCADESLVPFKLYRPPLVAKSVPVQNGPPADLPSSKRSSLEYGDPACRARPDSATGRSRGSGAANTPRGFNHQAYIPPVSPTSPTKWLFRTPTRSPPIPLSSLPAWMLEPLKAFDRPISGQRVGNRTLKVRQRLSRSV